MGKITAFMLFLIWSPIVWSQYHISETRTWDDYPPEVQKPGFGLHKSQKVQMDDNPPLEVVLLFSSNNGHYPYFDLFKNYYVIIDNYSKEVKYVSNVTISNERELQLEDRDNDGKFELYRKYFKDDEFMVDKDGNNLKVIWNYNSIQF
ncbi:hypothetical protein LCGC14_1420220 [marine sediment metagenome]|uniref:Uncharacterized protein n=2 Tax=root TaxID=1 RepID=A0A831VVG6_9FLAO|nr:hypothetical protein [Pricia antarctica]